MKLYDESSKEAALDFEPNTEDLQVNDVNWVYIGVFQIRHPERLFPHAVVWCADQGCVVDTPGPISNDSNPERGILKDSNWLRWDLNTFRWEVNPPGPSVPGAADAIKREIGTASAGHDVDELSALWMYVAFGQTQYALFQVMNI
jgi:hypothetical protein